MDKRTLIFVISLSLTLLFVNMFFDRMNQSSLREQHEKIKVQKIETRDKLASEIRERTAKAEELPLARIYTDSSESEILTTGTLLNGTLLALPWTDKAPETVYSEGQAFSLAFAEPQGHVFVYELKPENALPIGDLPYFGNYELQLVTPYPNNPDKAPLVTLGNYADGQFTIPLLKMMAINSDLEQSEKSKQFNPPGNALVLLKTSEGYLPVGVYNASQKSFTQLEQMSDLRSEIRQPQVDVTDQDAQENFFVLENDYQQLVFSNRGGALVEINLPFQSTSPESVVKQIGFDREIAQDHPRNARFPLRKYFTPGADPKGTWEEHSQGKLGGYYPLIRRDMLRTKFHKASQVLPEYYSMNIVSEYPEMAELVYKVAYFDQTKIVFEASQRNRKITKTYSLDTKAPYCIDLAVKVDGDSKGLWLTSGVPEVEMISNAPAPVMKYRITRKGKPEVNTIDKPTDSLTISDLYPDWVCNSNGFLGLILDPLSDIGAGFRAQHVAGTQVPSRLIMIDEEYSRFKAENLPGYMLLLPLDPKGGAMRFRIFAGPFASELLKSVDKVYSNPETGYNPDYIASQSFHGWFSFISAPFSKFLLILMNLFHTLTGSWAFSIILLTVALRLMLFPLNAWSTKSMLKMQKISPEVQKIQEKYKNEPQKAQVQIMNLYRESGVNPLSGCFPILIQMPFLIGMFDLLKSTFELRGAEFIPGWIDNLAAPDVLFSWSTPIFFIGTEFHLLPFLLGGVMFIQQRVMSTQPKDPSQLTDQQRQQRAMGTMMTVVFTVMFYHFPSGLNIYWLSSMLLGILQQWWTQKRFRDKDITLELQAEPVKKGKRKKKR